MANKLASSKKILIERGCHVDKAEQWISFGGKGGVRRDLFGFIDLVAIEPDKQGILGVQVTSYGHMATRYNKAKQQPAFNAWLAAGNRFTIHGWRKVKNRWVLKEREITK